jgi:hypothetical protein
VVNYLEGQMEPEITEEEWIAASQSRCGSDTDSDDAPKEASCDSD